MKIACPTTGNRRALLVIDVQPHTLQTDAARGVLAGIERYIAASDYSAYLVATFSAPADSMFARQLLWSLSEDAAGPTDPSIVQTIAEKGKPTLSIAKIGRSVFHGERGPDVIAFLKNEDIDEVHVVGFDINDCVLASAYDALDRGFFTYAIEECCARTDSNPTVTEAALTILRKQAMTNLSTRHSVTEIDLGE